MIRSTVTIADEREFERQHSVVSLRNGLLKKDKILYSKNGFRATRAYDFLAKIEKLIPSIGISQIADISPLHSYPVYQSCRPNSFYHSGVGKNTSARGKGPDSTQAKISCIMETFEQYCAEPRNPFLIRASYNFLRHQHVVADPKEFTHHSIKLKEVKKAGHSENLMWTNAYSVEQDCEVLVPAECVYYPFLSQLYNTRALFACNTNGLASGATYLEATVHALYEVIERHYRYLFEKGLVQIEAFKKVEISHPSVVDELLNNQDIELQTYALEIQGIKNIPVILCILAGEDGYHVGYGCSGTVEISIERAVSEAIQSFAALTTGIIYPSPMKDTSEKSESNIFAKTCQPEVATLLQKEYRKRVYDRKFKTISEEYKFLVNWLRKLGFSKIFVANLTRVGLDLPIVRVMVPFAQVESNLRKFKDSNLEATVAQIFPDFSLNRRKR